MSDLSWDLDRDVPATRSCRGFRVAAPEEPRRLYDRTKKRLLLRRLMVSGSNRDIKMWIPNDGADSTPSETVETNGTSSASKEPLNSDH
ncbi:unnamed protein product [Phytophthora lilii]|uniref:Unnamed protein product n=1 Tax=Phytophthora lilii TaxID=2077276 RepID=A0A9W6WWF1_9STRA|nr:unnamed protein product [Phytophthora lilii]